MADGADDKLEEKVNDKESKSFARKAFDLGFNTAFAAGATAFGMATIGVAAPIIGTVFGGGLLLGNLFKKGKSLYDAANDSVKAYGAINAVLYPVIGVGNLFYSAVNFANPLFSFLAKSAYALTVQNAFFVGSYDAAQHMSQNKLNPKGISKSISNNFPAKFKRIGLGFSPGYILSANGVADVVLGGLSLPSFAWNAGPVGVYNALRPPGEKKPEYESKDSQTDSKATQTPSAQPSPQNLAPAPS